MLFVLSDKQKKERNKELVEWVKKTLNGKQGTDLYNVLLMIQRLMEKVWNKQLL